MAKKKESLCYTIYVINIYYDIQTILSLAHPGFKKGITHHKAQKKNIYIYNSLCMARTEGTEFRLIKKNV